MEEQGFVIRQEKEMLEVFTDFETRNRYSISTPQGEQVLYAYEESGAISRHFLGTRRPFNIHIVDGNRREVLRLERPFSFLFQRVTVRDSRGAEVGAIQRRFGILRRTLDIESPSGSPTARIQGIIWRPWTFPVYQAGREVACIRKRWSGMLKETMTDADTFSVSFSEELPESMQHLVLAAAFPIDFDFFEKRG